MLDFITIGGATKDFIFLTDQGKIIATPENLTEQNLWAFEYGAKIKTQALHTDFGGGACNAAATFSKLGFDAAVMCRVGKDELGDSIIANLRSLNVDAGWVEIDEADTSAVSMVLVNTVDTARDRIIFVYRGAGEEVKVAEDKLNDAHWVYMTALGRNWKSNLKKVESVLEKKKFRWAWNPGAEELQAAGAKIVELLPAVDVLLLNFDEAIEMVGKQNFSADSQALQDPRFLLNDLKSRGAKTVVITSGSQGAYATENGEAFWHIPASADALVDTTGAGDAFGSAFVAGLELTGDLASALKFGVLNSGSVVGAYGAQKNLLNRSEVEARFETVEVVSL